MFEVEEIPTQVHVAQPWKLEITKANNGYIVKHNSDVSDSIELSVFEDPDQDPDEPDLEKTAMYSLLWFIIDHFGERGSKHDKQRIRIVVEKQEEGNE